MKRKRGKTGKKKGSSRMQTIARDEPVTESSKEPCTNPDILETKIPKNAPRFLRKTYEMINECDPVIASWSNNGEIIEIKDVAQFESKIMPQFFDSEKFASFNRQLNFYGFRKLASAELQKKESESSPKKLRFQNKLFQRNKPELMVEISRSTNRNCAEGGDLEKEIEIIKDKLHHTREKLSTLKDRYNDKINQMTKKYEERLEGIKKRLEDDSHDQSDT